MDARHETRYGAEQSRERALLELLMTFSLDINEMKALLYSCREKLSKSGRKTNRKVRYILSQK